MNDWAESIAKLFRKFGQNVFYTQPRPVYQMARLAAFSILHFLSHGRGHSVRVAGIYPLQVEWSRSSINFTTWEAEFMKAFCSALKEPRVVIDVGASIGEWSALAASLVGPENVNVFEPNPASWKYIRKIFKLNRLAPPAGIFPGFAANLDLFFPEVLIAATSRKWPPKVKSELEFENLFNPRNLPMIKLDTYCDELSVIPSVIKIDVEGSEGEVLRGSKNLLEKFHPLIFLSLHPWALTTYGDSKIELLRWIENRGYKCSLLATSHEEHWACVPNI